MTSLFELMIFGLGFFGTDYDGCKNSDETICKLLTNFEFMCGVNRSSIWFVEKGPLSMMLFKFHFIVIFMYSTIFLIVLFKIPYKYDRIKKTKKE